MTAFTDKARRGSDERALSLDTPCWVWRGCVQSSGYPSVCAGKKGVSVSLHRAVLAEKLGRPLVGMSLHSCDVKRCVNPDHLREGTATDNARDAVDRDRAAKGERNGRATITEEAAREIKALLLRGRCRQASVARFFGVPVHVVAGIARGIRGLKGGTWAHL